MEDLPQVFLSGIMILIFKWDNLLNNNWCLKSTHPLCYMVVKSTAEGVGISCGNVHWANLFDINTPPVE